MVEQRKQGRGSRGHFIGFWARLNCENMPVIPAWLVRANLDDPRKVPYLLVWKRESDGKIMEAVRLTCRADGYSGYVQMKRTDASTTVLGIVWRALPRNGGRALLLFCPYCQTPRRFFYGWEWDSFSSEGGYHSAGAASPTDTPDSVGPQSSKSSPGLILARAVVLG